MKSFSDFFLFSTIELFTLKIRIKNVKVINLDVLRKVKLNNYLIWFQNENIKQKFFNYFLNGPMKTI